MKSRYIWMILVLMILANTCGCGNEDIHTIKTDETKVLESVDTDLDDEKNNTKEKPAEAKTEKETAPSKDKSNSEKNEEDVKADVDKNTKTDTNKEDKPAADTNSDKKDTAEKPSTGKQDSSTSNSNNNSNSGNNDKPAEKPANKPSSTPTPTPKPTPEVHTHNWVVTKTIPHAEEGHWETKVIKEAWTEEIKGWVTRCGVCQTDLTNMNDFDLTNHVAECGGRYSTNYEVIDTIPHEAETEDVWVVDKEAYTETKYGCSCGATK